MDAYNTEAKKTKLVIVMSKYKERVYGEPSEEISKDGQTFDVGDLVVFNGKLFTPDYTYVDQTIESYATVGIVVSAYAHGNYIDSCIYRVYWFKSGRSTQTISGHLRRPTAADLRQ